jgi:hypothetical protein
MAIAVHRTAWSTEMLIGFYILRQIYFVRKFSHAKYKLMLRELVIPFVFYVTHAHMYEYTGHCCHCTVNCHKDEITCFVIAETEVAPGV